MNKSDLGKSIAVIMMNQNESSLQLWIHQSWSCINLDQSWSILGSPNQRNPEWITKFEGSNIGARGISNASFVMENPPPSPFSIQWSSHRKTPATYPIAYTNIRSVFLFFFCIMFCLITKLPKFDICPSGSSSEDELRQQAAYITVDWMNLLMILFIHSIIWCQQLVLEQTGTACPSKLYALCWSCMTGYNRV